MSKHPIKVSREEIVDELNRLIAEEAEAFLRYFHLRYRLNDADRKKADRFFDGAMKETAEHAEAIAAHIRKLGCTPQLKIHLNLDGDVISYHDALAEALCFEQQALDAYKDLLPRVKGDASLEEFVRQQVATETEHVEEIEKLLK